MAQIDYSFYSGEDIYSDGEVEDRILSYLKQNPADDYDEVLQNDHDLAVFYHLSDVRQALLSWYDFRPGCSILEIGGGMGALTPLLCERAERVFSVELSAKRAEAIVQRCRDKDNLTVMVGDVNEMSFETGFDYITLIGVLEHQSAISEDPEAHKNLLKKLIPFLAPGGKILIAIENRFGLKYWCGEVDDHTGEPFGTIRQAHYERKPRTFDRNTLRDMLSGVGLTKTKFFYPLPDYKFPRVIYSDSSLPKTGLNSAVIPLHYSNYYPWQSLIAEETELYSPIIANGVFPFFANSFLVESGTEKAVLSSVDFASVTVEREKEYRQIIRKKDGQYEKYAACKKADAHIAKSCKNLEELQERGFPVLPWEINQGVITMPELTSPTVEDVILQCLREGRTEAALEQMDAHYAWVLHSSEQLSAESNLLLKEYPTEAQGQSFGPILACVYADMIFSNCFVSEESILFYDQEWVFEAYPASFVMFLAISVLYNAHSWVEKVLPRNAVFEHFGISHALEALYGKLEDKLFLSAQNSANCSVIGSLRSHDERIIENNIKLLMNGQHEIERLRRELAQQQIISDEQLRQIAGRDSVIEEKDLQIAGRDSVIKEKDLQIAGRDSVIEEKDLQIAGRDSVIKEKDLQIAGRDSVIKEKDLQIAGRDSIIEEKDLQIAGRDAVIKEKERRIEELDAIIQERDTLHKQERKEVEESIALLSAQLKETQKELSSYHGMFFSDRLRIALRCLKG